MSAIHLHCVCDDLIGWQDYSDIIILVSYSSLYLSCYVV